MRWPRLNFFWARFRGSWATASRQSPNDQIEKGRAAPSRSTTFGRAFLRFENGATGSIEANWIATGRKMQHDFEVWGTRGALSFSQERLNELHWYSVDDRPGRRGFRRIETGPDHPPYGKFCVATGHQLGFNDLKAIEVAGFVEAIAGKRPEPFNFRAGLRIQALVETIQASSRSQTWLPLQ